MSKRIGRPRKDGKNLRILMSMRLTPKSVKVIAAHARRFRCSRGEAVDAIIIAATEGNRFRKGVL